jgi:hypothetical protein
MVAASNDREARLRRSLKRLGYELADAGDGQFYINHQGRRIHATSDLFGLSLDDVEKWIKEQVNREGGQRR